MPTGDRLNSVRYIPETVGCLGVNGHAVSVENGQKRQIAK